MSQSTIQIEHVRLSVDKPFDKFTASFEQQLGRFDPAAYDDLEEDGNPQAARAKLEALVGTSGFMLFQTSNHGLVLRLVGESRKAMQYLIGNPLFAVEMTRYAIGAALYAPLRVLIYEADDGQTCVEYDRPSSLFGQFNDENVNRVAKALDQKLQALIGNSMESRTNLDMSRTGDHHARRVFLAGASGVIGQRLIPRLVHAGYVVGGMTRSPNKTALLRQLGAEPILCDVFDQEALIQAVQDFHPDVILNELTDLPDDATKIGEHAELNARIRTEGNQNLIEAARQSGSPKLLAQTVAWKLPDGPDARAVAELERSVLAEGGVVLSYGQFYGPGTYNEQKLPDEPRVQIDRAAERTIEALGESTGVVEIVD